MAVSPDRLSFRKPLSLCLILLLFTSLSLCIFSEAQLHKQEFLSSRRRTLAVEKEEEPKKKTSLEKSSSSDGKNQTKTLKPAKLTTNYTTKAKPTTEKKNQTKLIKPTKTTTNSTSKTTLSNTELKNQTKPNSAPSKKSLDLAKDSKSNFPKNKTTSITKDYVSNSPKNKTSISNSAKNKTSISNSAKNKTTSITKQSSPSKAKLKTATSSNKSSLPTEKKSTVQKIKTQTKSKQPTFPNIFEDDPDNADLINEFRDLPSKFHEAIIPDLEKISIKSKLYISKANEEITQGFKPLVGKKYASIVGSLTSWIFLLVPLLLVSLFFNRIRIYFPLQKILIFIQVYLAIYFAILSLAHFVTGIEPLRFFYTTSRSSYITIQAFQTLGYVLYLLLQLLNLVVLFANVEDGVGMKFLGLAQTTVGFAVGLHYYAAVFHRAVVGQPPKTSWKIHAIYAVCFLVICLFARAERRKKVYLQEGSNDDGKKS